MQEEKITGEFDEEITIPDLATHFEVIPTGAKTQTISVHIPNLTKLPFRPRLEIAEMIVSLLDYKPGVVGFQWTFGKEAITLKYVDGFEQRSFEHEGQRTEFLNLVLTILKTRSNIRAIEWDFGDDHVKMIM